MLKVIEMAIMAWLVYKLIFDLVFPVAKVYFKMRNNVEAAKEQQKTYQQAQNSNQGQAKQQKAKPDTKDYIDFEEIKP